MASRPIQKICCLIQINARRGTGLKLFNDVARFEGFVCFLPWSVPKEHNGDESIENHRHDEWNQVEEGDIGEEYQPWINGYMSNRQNRQIRNQNYEYDLLIHPPSNDGGEKYIQIFSIENLLVP